MTLFEGLVGGGLGGFAGAAAGHLGAMLLIRRGWMSQGDALPAALSLGITLAVLGYGLSRRLKLAVVGLLGGSLAAAAAGKASVWLAGYALAQWGTISALGWLLAGRRGAVAAPAGALAGFLVLSVVPKPAAPVNPFVPPAADLLTFLFVGAGIGAALYLASRRPHDQRAA